MKAKTNHTYYLCPKKNGMPDITPNPENTLHIKNMVCNRCIMVVKSQLEQLGLHPLSVELGIAVLPDAVSNETYQRVKASLETFGFELIDDKKSQTVEQIKDAIIELVHYDDNGLKTNLSRLPGIPSCTGTTAALSKLFSETTYTTIEKYHHRTEDRACQRTADVRGAIPERNSRYAELFECLLPQRPSSKHVTGMTPSHFKKIKGNKRKPLDEI